MTTKPDVHGRLNLIAGEHPEGNACIFDVLDHLANFLLKLVLDGGAANQCKVFLDQLCLGVDDFISVGAQ